MLTEEEFVEASALHRRGWSIAAIARHLDRDRKTIRAYLRGERMPGVRRRALPGHFAPFEPYVRERLYTRPLASVLADGAEPLSAKRTGEAVARSERAGTIRGSRSLSRGL
jgi:transposase